MPHRVKDEERIEMIIRGLLKQPDNRRCINCNSLGPQYVCTTFWTFVCTSCSGVHREFSHRVKSVSIAKFNEEEIMSLQAGGNERAKQIYFKTWDPERNSYPESGNLQRIRELVNHVYIDRRYCGENKSNNLSMVQSDSRSISCEWPPEKSRWGKKDDFFGRSSFERTNNSGRDELSSRGSVEKASLSNIKTLNLKDFLEARSPRSPQAHMRSSSLRSSPARFEIVDDRFREDGGVKTYERKYRKESRGASASPRTVIPRVLRIEGPPKANDKKDAESSAKVEKVADATIPGSSGGKEKQNNGANTCTLIDFFDAEPEPASNPTEPQAQAMGSNNNTASSSVSSTTNQAVTDISNVNSMDTLLLEWSSPLDSSSAAKSNNFGTENSNTHVQDIQMQQLAPQQQLQSFVSPGNTSSSIQQSATSVDPSSNQLQHWNESTPSDDLRSVESGPPEQSSQTVNPGEGTALSARREIPEDLFSSHYPSFTPAVSGWHMQPPQGAAYGMQFHHPAMSAATFQNPPKPRNPFDIGDDINQVEGATFPSMSSLQGAMPNMPSSVALESQPAPYTATPYFHSHMSPYGMNMALVPCAYMGQLSTDTLPTRPQGNANVGRTEDAFASLNPIHQTNGTNSLPVAPTSPLTRAGNPFG